MSPTSKVFKRQPNSSAEEEKKDLISSKQRKIDTNTNTKSDKSSEPQLDFWQRRNQAKSKETVKDVTVAMEVQSDNTHLSGLKSKAAMPPSEWSQGIGKKEQNAVKVPSVFETGNKDKKEDPKPKGVNYADKFRELNDRNLKQLRSDDLQDKKKDKEEKTVFQPKAKPRQNVVSRFENMDTSEPSEPRPVPRFQKSSDNLSPKAAPRNTDSTSKPETAGQKSGFLNSKSPAQSHNEFKLNLKSVSRTPVSDESPSSPPPLPGTAPPKLPLSQPPTTPLTIVTKKETIVVPPKASPRDSTAETQLRNKKGSKETDRKSESVSVENKFTKKGALSAPSKPPRASAVIEGNRSQSPMDTGELHAPATAVVKGRNSGHDAVLVVPNRSNDEKKNREVVGGLLKSLANVRTKHENDNGNKNDDRGASDLNTKAGDFNKGVTKGIVGTKQMTDVSKTTDEVSLRKAEENNKPTIIKVPERPKTSYVPDRPKSSFLSQNKFLEQEKTETKSPVKVTKTTKTVTTTTIVTNETKKVDKTKDVVKQTVNEDDDVPEWKRKLEERKAAKARPKSSDLLTDKQTSNGEGMLDWQKEAAKRKEARKGTYDDPEKPKIKPSAITPTVNEKSDSNQNRDSDRLAKSPELRRPERPETKVVPPRPNVPASSEQTSKSPERKRIVFNGSVIDNDDTESAEKQKKKITVDFKFKFEDIDVKPGPKKPPRPAALPKGHDVPLSPKLHPARPPPPRSTPSFQVSIFKFLRVY